MELFKVLPKMIDSLLCVIQPALPLVTGNVSAETVSHNNSCHYLASDCLRESGYEQTESREDFLSCRDSSSSEHSTPF